MNFQTRDKSTQELQDLLVQLEAERMNLPYFEQAKVRDRILQIKIALLLRKSRADEAPAT